LRRALRQSTTDPEFTVRVRTDPAGVGEEFQLTVLEVATLQALTLAPTDDATLTDRLSRSSLFNLRSDH